MKHNKQVLMLIVIILTFTGLLIYCIFNKEMQLTEKITGSVFSIGCIALFVDFYRKNLR